MDKEKYVKPDNSEARKQFFEATKPIFETGAAQELYYNDCVSIINLADTLYVVTDYSKTDFGYVGFIFGKEAIMTLAEIDMMFYTAYGTLSPEEKKKRCIVFNEKTMNRAKELYEQTKKNGPSNYIDKDLDAALLEMKKKKMGGMTK